MYRFNQEIKLNFEVVDLLEKELIILFPPKVILNMNENKLKELVLTPTDLLLINRTWYDIWHEFNYLEINHYICNNFFSFIRLIEMELNISDGLNYFLYHYTPLFFIGTLMELVNFKNPQINCELFIFEYFDPKSSFYGFLIANFDFSIFIEQFSEGQLVLLSDFLLNYNHMSNYFSILAKCLYEYIYAHSTLPPHPPTIPPLFAIHHPF